MKTLRSRWFHLLAPLLFVGSAADLNDPISMLPGDFPDPSVIRVGNEYYGVATSGMWGPEYPLMKSQDLVHWSIAGAVFAKRPDWAKGDFWAPELFAYRGNYFVYYTARNRKTSSLCIGVARAPRPDGPYADQGPLICDSVGSIDAAPTLDENGALHLLWKIDGNSRQQPTPMVAQRMSEDGTKLIGERKELFSNDAPWEGQLVEGAFVQKRGDYFYLFYSGSSCCTLQCDYALGVTRSRKLLGPWEKYSGNPILAGNETWRCPGHGTVVQNTKGEDYLIYHAFGAKDSIVVGRQPLIDPIDWSAEDGWPRINGGKGPRNELSEKLSVDDRTKLLQFADTFSDPAVKPGWQWPTGLMPMVRTRTVGGTSYLELSSPLPPFVQSPINAVLGRALLTADFVAETEIDLSSLSPLTNNQAGLSAYGDQTRALGISVSAQTIELWRKAQSTLVVATLPTPAAKKLGLRVVGTSDQLFRFYYRVDDEEWMPFGTEMNGRGTPWDLGLRVALVASGGPEAPPVKFLSFKTEPDSSKKR